jgi:diguanylate cyclase (GGDEF)-like protein
MDGITMTAPEAWAEPGLDAALDVVVVLVRVIEQVRTADDLGPALADAASLAARGLGFGTVTINLARPLHDDFPVVVCEGPTANREALLGTSVARRLTDVVLQPRFERMGCYLILAGELDWDAEFDAPMYTPDIAPSADPRLWNADDALVLALRARDGELLGLMWLDEPLDGLRPSDAQLRLASIIGRHAAHAVEEATAVIRAQEHRLAMSHLLATSLILHGTDAGEVLQALCAAVHDALGFDRVAVTLRERSGSSAPRAAVGWSPEELAAWPDLDALERRLERAPAQSGCHLLSPETPPSAPRAWSGHTLLVPLRRTSGELTGMLCVDAPSDGLVPDEDRLRALRLFADQAATAVGLASRHDELHRLARRDALTGLGNRVAFTEELEARLAAGGQHALLLCDVDDFKSINDRGGHVAGDEALCTLARELGAGMRQRDMGFRLGGDEFCALLDGADHAAAVAASIRLGERLARRGIAASFGVAVALPGDTQETLLARADAQLYVAKEERR